MAGGDGGAVPAMATGGGEDAGAAGGAANEWIAGTGNSVTGAAGCGDTVCADAPVPVAGSALTDASIAGGIATGPGGRASDGGATFCIAASGNGASAMTRTGAATDATAKAGAVGVTGFGCAAIAGCGAASIEGRTGTSRFASAGGDAVPPALNGPGAVGEAGSGCGAVVGRAAAEGAGRPRTPRSANMEAGAVVVAATDGDKGAGAFPGVATVGRRGVDAACTGAAGVVACGGRAVLLAARVFLPAGGAVGVGWTELGPDSGGAVCSAMALGDGVGAPERNASAAIGGAACECGAAGAGSAIWSGALAAVSAGRRASMTAEAVPVAWGDLGMER